MEDIFIPKSSAEDALVGPLYTVTYVTNDPETLERIFARGFGLSASGWRRADEETASYLGFAASYAIEVCGFTKEGKGANIQVRAIHVKADTPEVRPEYLGLYKGGATISFPLADLSTHERRMKEIGIESTIGVKEMEFTSPKGETYISAEIVYKAPDHAFVLGVTRPSIFVPTGPIDADTGIGGPSYSARCITATYATVAFFRDVLGYEIRRDVVFEVGERSALLMPQGTKERFIQGFAPGAATGYVVLMDHQEATRPSPAPGFGPPNRGITMWTFPTKEIEEVASRTQRIGTKVLQPLAERDSPCLPRGRTMIVEDPDGFPIELVEVR